MQCEFIFVHALIDPCISVSNQYIDTSSRYEISYGRFGRRFVTAGETTVLIGR